MSTSRSKVIQFAENRSISLDGWGDTGFITREGSTFVHIGFSTLANGEEMISFFSPVVRGMRIDEKLMKDLLTINAQLNFGAFALEDDVVLLKYNILGVVHIDEDEFFNALAMVVVVSDEYDDKIIASHGGTTAYDFILELSAQK